MATDNKRMCHDVDMIDIGEIIIPFLYLHP